MTILPFICTRKIINTRLASFLPHNAQTWTGHIPNSQYIALGSLKSLLAFLIHITHGQSPIIIIIIFWAHGACSQV